MDNKPRGEILKELENSKKTIAELKATLKANEEHNKELLTYERLLSQSAMELVEIGSQVDIHEFTAQKIEIIFPESLILVTSYDRESGLFGLASLKGLKSKHLKLVNRVLGDDFFDIKADYKDFDEVLQKCLYTRNFKEMGRGLYAATGQVFPQRVCLMVEKILGIQKTYGMGMMWDNRLYGAVAIFSRGEVVLDKKDIVETLINMVSVALQRRNAEDEIKKALDEKELLMKEIHHRSKNNLSIISSLLNIQSRYATDQHAQKVLKNSQDRARCMALIHDKLYNSQDLKNIDFANYLRNLTQNLFYSYVDRSQSIKLNLNIEETHLDIDTAVPLGLMVNELITNCIKYAFPDGNSGEINLEFYSENEEYILGISDNGVGIPEDFDFHNSNTLGLQIVTRLTNQLKGEMEIDTSNGTQFRLTFREQNFD